MDMVCEHLNLLEKDYFGLTFADTDTQKVSESCGTLTHREAAAHKQDARRIICIPLSGWLRRLYRGGMCISQDKMENEGKFIN